MTKIVTYTNSTNQRKTARLVKQNKITAIVKPHKWLKSKAIKIHMVKQDMRFTGEEILDRV